VNIKASSQLREWLRLYLVTDSSLLNGRTLSDVVLAAVNGGVSCVQLREKDLDTRDFCAQAFALMALLKPHGVPLVINDRVDIALACGAQGVHLGQSDLAPEHARGILPDSVFIGWSVETPEHIGQASQLAVDYLGVSPVFATSTKTDTKDPWGLHGLRKVRAATELPLVAIGGINLKNASDVLDAGADGLAVVSAICAAADPRSAARVLREVCDAHR